MRRVFSYLAGFAAASMFLAVPAGFSRVQEPQNRIPQQIVINGLTVNAASVVTPAGQVQRYTCSAPQHYMTLNGSSQGWACYDETTGVWLMNAVPPVQAPAASVPAPLPPPSPRPVYSPPPAPVYQQPQVYQPQVYQQPPPVVYQQPAIIYQQAPPAVIYTQPAIVYAQPVSPVVVAPVYPPSVVLGVAAIGAVGRIASAAIISSRYPRVYYYAPVRGRRW